MKTSARRVVTLATTTGVLAAMSAAPALALHCSNAEKPLGAGAITLSDVKVAGNSGQLVLPGGFVSADEVGSDHDVFLHGPDKTSVPFLEEFVLEGDTVGQSLGTLPENSPHLSH